MVFTCKKDKYIALSINYDFIVTVLETLDPPGAKTSTYLRELGRCLTIATEDPYKTTFLFQHIFIAVQRCNAIRIRGDFPFKLTLTRLFFHNYTRPILVLLSHFSYIY